MNADAQRIPRVQVILDSDDTRRAYRAAAAAERPGVAVCRATPAAAPPRLARDVLRALGKRFDVTDSPGRPDVLWPRVTTWLHAETVVKLIVLRAHLLPAVSITQLLHAAPWPTELALVVHQPRIPRSLADALADARVQDIDLAEVDNLAAAAAGTTTTSESPGPPPLPRLPHDDFLFFLEACARVLDEPGYARVERTVADGRRATSLWLDSVAQQDRRSRRPTGSYVAAFLRALTDCADTQEALARLRGAQIALFFEDLLVKVDAVGFIAAREAAAARPHLDARAVRLLRGYSSPTMTAAGALAIAAGAGSGALSRLTVRDVASDGAEARIDGYPVLIPGRARPLIRAQHAERQRAGAAPADAFFPHRKPRSDAAPNNGLRKILARMTTQTGLAMPHPDESPESSGELPDARDRRRAL